MSGRGMNAFTRRDFLGMAVVLTGAAPFVPSLFPYTRKTGVAPGATYRSLAQNEATFTEILVSALCPADDMTPNGVTCGLVTFIDRQLAGEFGAQPSSQWPLSKQEFFKDGVIAADVASRRRFGVPFDQLGTPDAGVFLAAIASGRVTEVDFLLASWHKQIVHPLLVQASFSGPIYSRYGNRVFTKIF
jgi:gluconate 2-dehydrogenase gamma chain